MRIFADLHIHGRFSRATSRELNVPNLVKYAKMKGIGLLGTGDFTHSVWLEELKGFLKEDGSGILRDESGFGFVLSSEISSIYSQGGRVRRIHNIILSPGFEEVEQINDELRKRGTNLDSDGRPITGMRCPEIVDIVRSVSQRNEVIPAHIWTPWFSLFGSMSGFDSVGECFQDMAKHIHALETGLSSDPVMNWRLSSLDRYSLVSFSDSHSFWPWRIGREATVFDVKKLTYDSILKALRTKEGIVETIEVEPSYGKYHLDGHRACGVVMEPGEARKHRNICPKCGRPLTIGVLHRVEELADREQGFVPQGAHPFRSLIPLSEIIAAGIGTMQPFSKKVWVVYNSLLERFGSEFRVMTEVSGEELRGVVDHRVAGLIMSNREGKIEVRPGYDGVYGYPVIEGAKSGRDAQEGKPAGVKGWASRKQSRSLDKGPSGKQRSLSDF